MLLLEEPISPIIYEDSTTSFPFSDAQKYYVPGHKSEDDPPWNCESDSKNSVPGHRRGRSLSELRENSKQFYNNLFVTSSSESVWELSHREIASPSAKEKHIHAEEVVHRKGCSFVIHPYSRFATCWQSLILLALLPAWFMIPARIAFEDHADGEKFATFDIIYEGLFFFDIVMNFVTGYKLESGLVELNHKNIQKYYLRRWFVVDVISVFPWMSVLSISGKMAVNVKLFKIVKFTKTLKLTRLHKLSMFSDFFYSLPIPNWLLRLFILLCCLLGYTHLVGCLWFYIASFETDDGSWIEVSALVVESGNTAISKYKLYWLSIYWALETSTTVGYGDIVPATIAEVVFSIVILCSGYMFFTYLAATISSSIIKKDTVTKRGRKFMLSVHNFVKEKKLTPSLRNELMDTFVGRLGEVLDDSFDWTDLKRWITPELQWTVINEIYRDVFINCRFLRDLGDLFDSNVTEIKRYQTFVIDLVTLFRPIHYTTSQIITNIGGKVKFWYIVSQSNVSLEIPYISKTLIVRAGSTLGQCALFYGSCWGVNLYSVPGTKVYSVCMEKLEDLVHTPENRSILKQFRCSADQSCEILEKYILADSLYKDSLPMLRTIGWAWRHGSAAKSIRNDNRLTKNTKSALNKLMDKRILELNYRIKRQYVTLDKKIKSQYETLSDRIVRFETSITLTKYSNKRIEQKG